MRSKRENKELKTDRKYEGATKVEGEEAKKRMNGWISLRTQHT
jgi:hypothetical protein